MNRKLTDNIENLKALCLKYNVKLLHAFGSVCTENINKNSDIDLY